MQYDFSNQNKGNLFLVATPIGNDGDISLRAIEILKSVDLVAAEDTRVTAILLSKHNIHKSLESYHEHNKAAKGSKLINLLKDGLNIALVTDAGMPCISDPGESLVRLCHENDVAVTVVPGANAALTALSASGLDTSRFVFEGFLPVESKDRKQRLTEVSTEKKTIILYEAPHRLKRTLDDLSAVGLEDRKILIARELTKKYEEWKRLSISEAKKMYSSEKTRGEYVIVIEGDDEYQRRCPPDKNQILKEAEEEIKKMLEQGISVSRAAKILAETSTMKKNELYQLGLDLQSRLD